MLGRSGDLNKLKGEIKALKARIGELEDAKEALDVTLLDWQTTFDAIQDPVMLLDENNKVLRTNRAMEKFMGLASADIIGKTCYKIMHNSDFPVQGCPLEKAKRSRKHEEGELYLKDKDRWVSVSFDPIIDVKDNFLGGVHIIIDITERRKTQCTLDNESSFHAAVIKNAAEGIAVCHEVPGFPYVNFTVWNDRMLEITGYCLEEINKNGWYQSVYPDAEYQEKARQRMGRMRQGDNLRNEEWVIIRSDGQRRVLGISTGIIKSADSSVHVMALMQDLTEQKRAQEQVLSLSKFPLENPNPVLRVTKEGRIIYANPAAEAISFYGCRSEAGLCVPDRWQEQIRRAFEPEKGKDVEFEVEYEGRVVSFIVAPVMDMDYVNLYGRDITERKRLEREVLRERDLAQAYFDISGFMMVVIGVDEKVDLVNQKACEILEADKNDIIEKNWFDNFVPEAERENTRSVFHRIIHGESGLFGYYENNIAVKGRNKLIAWNNTWLKDETGKMLATLSSGEDITEKRRAEEALESSERLYHLLADNVVDFVWTTDMDFNFLYVSPSVSKLLGYRPEELEHKNGSFVITPECMAEGMRVLSEELAFEASGNVDIYRTRMLRFEHIRKDGKIVWAEANIAFSRDKDKKPIGIIGICRDITERLKLETEAKKHLHELEVFFKTSAGREERIIELKEEIRRLKKELGKV